MKARHLIILMQAVIVASLLASFTGFFAGALLMASLQAVLLASFCCLLFIGMKNADSRYRNCLLLHAFIYAVAQLPWLAGTIGFGAELKAWVNAGVLALLVFIAAISRILPSKSLECWKGNN